jgi:hypothetical protein
MDDATRAELAASDDGWLFTLVRRSGPRVAHFYSRNAVGDGISGGDPTLEDVEAVTAYFGDRLKAAGYDPKPTPAIGTDVAAWDLAPA